ncbi:hypothetical protein D3C81_1450330 [compost metagenome]
MDYWATHFLIKWNTREFMGKDHIIRPGQICGVIRKIRIINKPYSRSYPHLPNALDLFCMIVRENVQSIHNEHQIRSIRNCGFKHRLRRSDDAFRSHLCQCCGYPAVNSLEVLWNIKNTNIPS